MLARGATLAQIKGAGLTIYEPDPAEAGSHRQTFAAPLPASDNAADLGVQDLLIISLKYNGLPSLAPELLPLIGPDTVIVSAMNGVPWWFPVGLSEAPAGLRVSTVDPDGEISAALPTAQVLGCVVHLAGSTRGPGVIQRNTGNRLILGEPSHEITPRLNQVCDLLTVAGFEIERSENIHADLWYKLWGNMTMNPVSALTGAMSDVIMADPQLRSFLVAVMLEAAAVGEKIGLPIAENPEDRINVTASLWPFKTSMLQDAEAGKPLELDALVTVVREIAQQVGVATPATDALLGLTRVFASAHQLN